MEKKPFALVLFLVILFMDGFMVEIDARMCYSKSRKFHGPCFFRHQLKNCRVICKKEKFIYGRCSRNICLCGKPCGSAGHPPPLPQHPPPAPAGGEGGGEGGDAGGGGEGGGGEGGGGGGGGEGGGENQPQKHQPNHKH